MEDWLAETLEFLRKAEILVAENGGQYLFQHWVIEDVTRLRQRIREIYWQRRASGQSVPQPPGESYRK